MCARYCNSGTLEVAIEPGGRPREDGRASSTLSPAASVSGQPSRSDSTGFWPCHVIAGRTTSTGAAPRGSLTTSGHAALRPPEVANSEYTSASASRGMRTAIVLPCEIPLRITPPRLYGASLQRTARGSGPTAKRAIDPGRTGTSGPVSVKYATDTPPRATAPRFVGGSRRGPLPLLPALSATVTENAYEPSGAGWPFTSPSQVAVWRPRLPVNPATCLALPPSVRHTP